MQCIVGMLKDMYSTANKKERSLKNAPKQLKILFFAVSYSLKAATAD